MTWLPAWRSEAVALLLGGALMGAFTGVLLIAALQHFHLAGFRAETDWGTLLLATLSLHGAALLLSVPFLRYHHTGWRAVLGLNRPGLTRDLVWALFAFALLLPVTLALQAASVAVFQHFHWATGSQAAVQLLLAAKSPVMRGYLILFAVVIAPVAEEFLFRGVLFPVLRQLGLPVAAWLVPNFLFALIHGDPVIGMPLFGLALGLTWLYQHTGRLVTNILVHSLFNAANVVVLLCFTS
jgi:membrane protease YdiL (CAAX protease family)